MTPLSHEQVVVAVVISVLASLVQRDPWPRMHFWHWPKCRARKNVQEFDANSGA